MYKYVRDKKTISSMKQEGAKIINQLKTTINADDYIRVDFELVGSAARNLVTRNGNLPPDIDYNLFITEVNDEEYDISIRDGQKIKDCVMEVLNEILKKRKLKNCKDSTSVLTIKNMPLNRNENFNIDIAIVYEDDDNMFYRLIHKKTDDRKTHQWYWNKGRDYSDINELADEIKDNGLWDKVVDKYLKRKNALLKKQDTTHPSFVVFIETIHNVYNDYLN